MRKRYYTITGVNETFRTLKDAKYYIYVAYTNKERKQELRDSFISGVCGDVVTSYVDIRIDDNGNVTYSRAHK